MSRILDHDSGQETVLDYIALPGRRAAEGNDGVVLHRDADVVVAAPQRSDAVRGRADVVALHGDRPAEDLDVACGNRNHVAGRGGAAANCGRAADQDAVAAVWLGIAGDWLVRR